MKRVLLLGLIILLSVSVFATSFSSIGTSAFYDAPYNHFELGFLSSFSSTFPVEETPLEIGFGTRLDLAFSIPLDTLTFGFISGLAFVTSVAPRIDITALLGPQMIIIIPQEAPSLIGFGGGIDLSLTLYLNSKKRVGFTVGTINYLSACLIDKRDDVPFGYYGGGYIALTVRTDDFFLPLPLSLLFLDSIFW